MISLILLKEYIAEWRIFKRAINLKHICNHLVILIWVIKLF